MMRKAVGLRLLVAGLGLVAGLASGPAWAERVLRLEEVPLGESDPAKVQDYADSILMMNVYDTLTFAKPGGGVQPQLAESWESSEDGRTYTFKLKEASFHDGSPVTADDVVFSLERMNALGMGFAHLFRDVSASAVDERTVAFQLAEPSAPFLATLVRLPIMNKDLVLANKQDGDYGENGDYGQAWISSHDAGSGAYAIASHNPQEQTEMTLFADYFGEVAENAPEVVRMRYGIEPATIRTLVARQELEVTSQWIPLEIKKALSEMDGVGLVSEGGAGYFILPMNTQRPPTDDVHVRRAIAYALDYDAFVGLMQVTDEVSSALPMKGALPTGMLGASDDLPGSVRDLEAAKAELAQSKYAGGEMPPLELIWVAEVALEEKVGLLIQHNLSEIGIPVNLTKVPWALLVDQVTKPESTPNMTQRFVSAPYPDPDALIGQNHSGFQGRTLNMTWWDGPEFDALLEKAATVIDEDERARLYGEAQQILIDQRPALWPFQTLAVFVKQDYVTAPPLEDPSLSVAAQGGNFRFKDWSVNR